MSKDHVITTRAIHMIGIFVGVDSSSCNDGFGG